MHTPLHTGSRPAVTRSDLAYRDIKQGLLRGDYPLVAPLSEERLAQRLGVSRTPVREAVLRLHAEGLLQRGPDGRHRPVAPDVTMIRHLYELRCALEVEALARPARLGTVHDPEALAALQDEWRALAEDQEVEPSPEFVLVDESFHVALAEAAGNPVLCDHLRQVNERIRLVRMQDFLTAERLRQTVTEHLELLDAVMARDIRLARRRFERHLSRSVEVVEERTARALSRMMKGDGSWG